MSYTQKPLGEMSVFRILDRIKGSQMNSTGKIKTWYTAQFKCNSLSSFVLFDTTKKEQDSIVTRLLNVRSQDTYIAFGTTSNTVVFVYSGNIVFAQFLFDSGIKAFENDSKSLKVDDYCIKIHMVHDEKPMFFPNIDPSDFEELFDDLCIEDDNCERDTNEFSSQFFSFVDEDGEDFIFNRTQVVYIEVSQKLIDDVLQKREKEL